MGMCKECKEVFPATEMKDGLCKNCISPENLEKFAKQELQQSSRKLNSINLKHKDTGVLKTVPVGFSWTSVFFGLFVPLIRGDLKWFIISILITIFTMGIGNFFIIFFYNKIYIKELMEKGYVPADEASRLNLIQRNIISE